MAYTYGRMELTMVGWVWNDDGSWGGAAVPMCEHQVGNTWLLLGSGSRQGVRAHGSGHDMEGSGTWHAPSSDPSNMIALILEHKDSSEWGKGGRAFALLGMDD
uniref:Uncharacterized protein n=1 Tax=Triticum urartu TaxID=4572 RepID=A0A8R7UVZ3_TRIUA